MYDNVPDEILNEDDGELYKAQVKSGVLKSQVGASFALALLLFLVCALLSSVIISAASAAAGHHSRLAEAEQRYQSVTSAVKLIESQFEGAEAKVSCSQVEDAEDPSAAIVADVAVGDLVLTEADPRLTKAAKEKLSLPELSALYLLQGSTGSAVDMQQIWDNSDPEHSRTFNLTGGNPVSTVFSLMGPGGEGAPGARVEEIFRPDGSLRFVVSSESGGETYKLTLVCDADIEASESTTDAGSVPKVSDDGKTVQLTPQAAMTTRTTTLRWAPTSVHVGEVAS